MAAPARCTLPQIARETGIRRVLIPRAPGHFSACGMLFCDLRYDFVQTRFTKLDDLDFGEFLEIFGRYGRGRPPRGEPVRIGAAEIRIARALDMRYVGQEHLVTIEIPPEHFERHDRAAIKRLFDEEHAQRYGTSAPAEGAEIASLRSSVTGILVKPDFERIATRRNPNRRAQQCAAHARHGSTADC